MPAILLCFTLLACGDTVRGIDSSLGKRVDGPTGAEPNGEDPAEEKPKNTSLEPGAERKGKPKVLIIGIDGLRPDALAAANTPNMDTLFAAGAFSAQVQANDTTWSGPGWSTILTGVWRDKHGVTDNQFSSPHFDTYPDLFARIEASKPALNTVRISSWSGLNDDIPSGADQTHKFDYEKDEDDTSLTKAIEVLGGDVDVVFTYFVMADVAGHAYGFHPAIPEYIAAIDKIDVQVGALLAKIKARPSDEDWLVVTTTDHGGTEDGTHGRNLTEHRTTFLAVSGAGTVQGTLSPAPLQVDVVPTVLDYLGIDVPASWNLDGRSVGLTAQSTLVPALGQELVTNGDAEFNRGHDGFAMEGATSGWIEAAGSSAVKYGSAGGFPTSGSGANFFAGAVAGTSSMSQAIDVSSLSGQFTLSAELGGKGSISDSAKITARFYTDERFTVIKYSTTKAYFFQGSTYARYDLAGFTVDAGYPMPIAGNWPGLEKFTGGAKDIDAAFEVSGKILFFKGDEYVKFDRVAEQVDAGFPKKIAAEFPGLDRFEGGAKDINAAIVWSDGDIFFFKGRQYIRYNMTTGTAPKYPRVIDTETWPGVHIWASGFDDVLDGPNGKLYFFKRGSFIRYDKTLDRIDPDFPQPVSELTWPGLTDWYASKHGATIGPVKATDRGNATSLLPRTFTGTVPAGAKRVEIEAYFDGADAYADDISLVIDAP